MAKKKVCPVTSRADTKRRIRQEPTVTDPQGSYTGRPLQRWETPVQDADDL